jgi:hypothetical protein
MKGIRLGVAVGAAALMMLAVSATSASADTVQLSSSCKVTSTLQGDSCTTRLACPDTVQTSTGLQSVAGCVATGEVLAAGELTGLLRATVVARPRYGGISSGPRVRASCSGRTNNCRARSDAQTIGNGGPTGRSDVERARCSTKKSLGVIFVHTRCIVSINAVTTP